VTVQLVTGEMVRVAGVEPALLAEPDFEPAETGYALLRSSVLEHDKGS